MMDSATVESLHAVLVREGQSLFQYVNDAFPWTTAEGQAELSALEKMIAEERTADDALARLLTRRHLPLPYMGSYPLSFTSINFVSLSHLIPLLIEQQRRAIADLQPRLAALNDADARQLVQNLVDMKQRHLKELEQMAAPAALAR